MRPIALASHISKAFARLLLSRLSEPLQVRGYKQFAAKGRQPAEFLWVALQTLQLSKEWRGEAYILKLDLRKAFDGVYRDKLAEKIVQWCQGRFPDEVRCLVRMLMSSDMVVALFWNDHPVDANIGVKQGAPVLFARLLDDLLSDICMEQEGIPVDGACYMDDILGWKSSIEGMQKFVDVLVPKLAAFGLRVQPAKCKLMCVRGSRVKPLYIDGQQLMPLPEGEALYVMNLPLLLEATEVRIIEHLVDRARKKFYGILHLLTSKAPLGKRFVSSTRWSLV